MLILGVDPGLNTTGYGLIETVKGGFILRGAGAIKTNASDGMPRRLETIRAGMAKIIETHNPEAMAIEKLFTHYKHPVTAALLGHARGVVCALADQKHIAFFEYAPTQVKRMTAGSGHASKRQIQKMVEHILSMKREFTMADITDALALAITHAYTLKTLI